MTFNITISIDTKEQEVLITEGRTPVVYDAGGYGLSISLEGILDCLKDYLNEELDLKEVLEEAKNGQEQKNQESKKHEKE